MQSIEIPKGIWSATPTPFTEKMELDIPSIHRMVEHHLRLGVKGLFLGGTSGEGPYMRNADLTQLVEETAKASAGRLMISVQVTDNSAVRVLDNISRVANSGADIVVVAPPNFRINNTPENLLNMFREIIRESSIPVSIYDRGSFGPIVVPEEVLKKLYHEENIVMIKDSSADPHHMEIAIEAKKKSPKLVLFNGDEFNCTRYIEAGYDGLLLGGAAFHGFIANMLLQNIMEGRTEKAREIEIVMIEIMNRVFGGNDASCWLSGQKRIMVELGIFSSWKSYYNFPLTKECEQDIIEVVKKYKDWLLP